MRNIRTIYNEYKAAKDAANIDLTAIDNRLLPAFGAKKRQAEEKLLNLKAEFHDAVKKSLAGIMIVNTSMAKTKRFVSIAKSIMPIAVQGGDALYKEIAQPVIETMSAQGIWPRMIDTAQWTALFSVMRDKVEKMQCMILPSGRPMQYPDTGRHIQPLQSIEDINRVIKEMIRHANGDEFNNLYLSLAIAEAVFSNQDNLAVYEADAPEVVPVILTGIDESEVQGLASLFGKGHLVVNDVPQRDAITKDYVFSKLEQLREKVINK